MSKRFLIPSWGNLSNTTLLSQNKEKEKQLMEQVWPRVRWNSIVSIQPESTYISLLSGIAALQCSPHGSSCGFTLHLSCFATASEVHIYLLQTRRNNRNSEQELQQKQWTRAAWFILLAEVAMLSVIIRNGKEKLDLNNPDAEHWFNTEHSKPNEVEDL